MKRNLNERKSGRNDQKNHQDSEHYMCFNQYYDKQLASIYITAKHIGSFESPLISDRESKKSRAHEKLIRMKIKQR